MEYTTTEYHMEMLALTMGTGKGIPARVTASSGSGSRAMWSVTPAYQAG